MYKEEEKLGLDIEYVNIKRAATYYGCSEDSIRNLMHEGILPAYRMGKRLIRIKIFDLEKVFQLIPSAVTK